MAVSVADYLGIPAKSLESRGAFNAILDVDSRLFVDPLLLRRSTVEGFQGADRVIDEHLSAVLHLLRVSQQVGDAAWRSAARRLQFQELPNLSLGYSSKGTAGRGIGSELRDRLLFTAREIVRLGIDDPAIFDLIGLLEEGIGADRISDMFARIALAPIAAYSQHVFREAGVEDLQPYPLGDSDYSLPSHPFAHGPILIVPREVLRNLPVANSWAEIDEVVSANAVLRNRVNDLIGESWRRARYFPKGRLRDLLLSSPQTLRGLIRAYRETPAQSYNFSADPDGQVVWYSAAKDAAASWPMRLMTPETEAPAVFDVVMKIVEQYKQLIEVHKWWYHLYDSDGKRKREEASQLLFFGAADAYCRANDVDLSPEADGGRGPVDFKMSRGYSGRVVVEVKLSSNSQLVHGYETQVREYQAAEKTRRSVYIVIDVDGSNANLRRLRARVEEDRSKGVNFPLVSYIDGRPKASASKYAPVPPRWDGLR